MQCIEFVEGKQLRYLFLHSSKNCDHVYEKLKETHLGSSTGDFLCSNCFTCLEFNHKYCIFMGSTFNDNPILKGYIQHIRETVISGFRKNPYQVISIAMPLFNKNRFFLNDFKYYDIVFFTDGPDMDFKNDFEIGDFIITSTQGNK